MDQASPTRERLRAAALNLFVQKGIAETTTRELAAMAGVAEGTIYRHYASKEDLVRELFEDHYFRFGSELDRIRGETAGGVAAKLAAMVAFMASLYDSDPTLYRFLLLAQHTALPSIPKALPESPASSFRRLIVDAIAAGEIPPQNATLSAAMLIGAIIQPALALIYGTLDGPMTKYVPEIVARGLALIERSETKLGDQR
ncbi:TetR/AcrR family transcriptional regulator [Dongia sp. agr-C8]